MDRRPQRPIYSQALVTSLIYLVLASMLLWVGACAPRRSGGPRPHQPAASGPVDYNLGDQNNNPSAGAGVIQLSPSLPMVSGAVGRPASLVRFESPVIEPPQGNDREVTFRVEVISESGRTPVVLSGSINSAGRFNLDEQRPSANGAPIRAIGQCLELSHCRQLYVDIFYIENGQHRRQQFQHMGGITTAAQPPAASGGPPPSAPRGSNQPSGAPAVGAGQKCDEFQGCEGEYVGHQVDEPFYEPLRDWRGTPPPIPPAAPAPPADGRSLPSPEPRAGQPAKEPPGAELRGRPAPGVEPAPGEASPPVAPPSSGEIERRQPHPEVPPPRSRDPIAGDSPRGRASPLSIDEVDLQEGAQSVGLPYTICFVPCAQGLCQKQKCGSRDTNRRYGALTEGTQGPNFIELGGGPGFEKINPGRQHHYGSGLLVRLLEKSSQLYREQFDPRSVLQINDMSKRNGGPLGRHASHQSGLDADIAYLSTQPGWRSFLDQEGKLIEGFEVEKNLQFFKLLVDSGHVNRIFVDRQIKDAACAWAKDTNQLPQYRDTLLRLRHYPGHHDHFHLRLHCSRFYPLCRDQQPPSDLDCP